MPWQIDFDLLSRRNCALWQGAATKAYRAYIEERQHGQRVQGQAREGQNLSVGALARPVMLCRSLRRAPTSLEAEMQMVVVILPTTICAPAEALRHLRCPIGRQRARLYKPLELTTLARLEDD